MGTRGVVATATRWVLEMGGWAPASLGMAANNNMVGPAKLARMGAKLAQIPPHLG